MQFSECETISIPFPAPSTTFALLPHSIVDSSPWLYLGFASGHVGRTRLLAGAEFEILWRAPGPVVGVVFFQEEQEREQEPEGANDGCSACGGPPPTPITMFVATNSSIYRLDGQKSELFHALSQGSTLVAIRNSSSHHLTLLLQQGSQQVLTKIDRLTGVSTTQVSPVDSVVDFAIPRDGKVVLLQKQGLHLWDTQEHSVSINNFSSPSTCQKISLDYSSEQYSLVCSTVCQHWFLTFLGSPEFSYIHLLNSTYAPILNQIGVDIFKISWVLGYQNQVWLGSGQKVYKMTENCLFR